ncbi:MAG: glycosyltransferase [Thermoanaerobaculia bacterium]
MNAPPAAPPLSAGVRIVLPVSGAPELLARCLDSLVGATDLVRHRLHLVLDGPQDDAVEAVVRKRIARLGDPLVDRLAQRRGFAPAVNHGIRSAEGADIVLLNSDTEVPPGWLERLIEAAGSGERIASVTPLTNHGTIVSVPRSLVENRIPSRFTTATFDALVERVAERSRPRLPTGVGFCLYLRRAALDEIGPFDEARFGAGYGEEVDWCLRAAAAGWEHCADDATFVHHQGGGSFGAAKQRLEKRAESILRRRHRGWKRELSSFLDRDPLAPVRQRILAALAPAPIPAAGSRRLRVLHVVHGWPPWNYAGTELYAARLARAQATTMEVSAFGRIHEPGRVNESTIDFEDRGVRLRLVQNDFSQRLPWERNALANPRIEAAFDRFLNEVAPDIVHVHHLAGHSLRLARTATRRGIPVVWQIQDWWHACARANLMHADRHLCAGPEPVRCGRCLPMTGLPPRSVWNPALHLLRRHLSRRALTEAALFVAGSRVVLDDLARFGMPRRHTGAGSRLRGRADCDTAREERPVETAPRRIPRFAPAAQGSPSPGRSGVRDSAGGDRAARPGRSSTPAISPRCAPRRQGRARPPSAVRGGRTRRGLRRHRSPGRAVDRARVVRVRSPRSARPRHPAARRPPRRPRRAPGPAGQHGIRTGERRGSAAPAPRDLRTRGSARHDTAGLAEAVSGTRGRDRIDLPCAAGRGGSRMSALLLRAASLLRTEGVRGLAERLRGRWEARLRRRRFRAAPESTVRVAAGDLAVVNILPFSPDPSNGGVAIALAARLESERHRRPVALLAPSSRGWRLELENSGSASRPARRRVRRRSARVRLRDLSAGAAAFRESRRARSEPRGRDDAGPRGRALGPRLRALLPAAEPRRARHRFLLRFLPRTPAVCPLPGGGRNRRSAPIRHEPPRGRRDRDRPSFGLVARSPSRALS